jgi:hypothetical protein
MMRMVLVAAVSVMGCAKDDGGGGKAPKANVKEDEPQLVGVWPKEWTCDRIASVDEIGQMLGGHARAIESPVRPPDGVPVPCNYLLELPVPTPANATGSGSGSATPPPPPTESWIFDLDCRDSYKQKADALFAQYTRTSADLVQQYNAASDAAPAPKPKGYKPTAGELDASPGRAPEDAHEVQVGARGLDHHGQGLLFIDDDAPCYVRVVGPDADRRLALARHVASRLELANAPMTPRAAP